MTINAVPIINLPELYMNGLGISNDATTPNTIVDIATGACRDSTNTFDIVLNAAVKINAANNGLNGLDTGSLAASTVYAVHAVSAPSTGAVSGAILSLSSTAPTLPFGYSQFRVIGYIATDSSSHFLPGTWQAGNGATRRFMFNVPQATAVTAGAATSFTAIDLSALVPAIQCLVTVNYAYTPASAGNALTLTSSGNAVNTIAIKGQVSSVVLSNNIDIFANVVSSKAKVDYKVGNASDAVAIDVAGYQLTL